MARSAYSALRAAPHPLPLSDLAAAAGLVHSPGAASTPSQLRTLAGHLRTLSALGLAVVDATGRWSLASGPMDPQALVRAARAQRVVADAVAAERAAYADLQPTASRWARSRAAALARQAKADVARRTAWWAQLDPAEREQRVARRAAAFAARPVLEQDALKTAWATHRGRAGGGALREAARHDAWITAVPAQEYAVRVAERTAAYAALPPPLQAAAAAAWAAHRARWNVPRGAPAPAAVHLPDTAVLSPSSAVVAAGMFEPFEPRGHEQLALLDDVTAGGPAGST